MKKIEFAGNLRTKTGKGVARQLRRNGFVPGIVYGNNDNLLISLNSKDLSSLLRKSGANIILHLKIEKNKDRIVVFKEIQKDVITRDLLHIDLMEISMNKKLRLSAPIEETGTAIGIKTGGILTRLLREIKIECLPADIPQSIKIDITHLEVGQNLHVSEIKVPSGITILDNPDDTVFAVNLPEAEKSTEEAEEAAEEVPAAAEGAAEAPSGDKGKSTQEKDKEK